MAEEVRYEPYYIGYVCNVRRPSGHESETSNEVDEARFFWGGGVLPEIGGHAQCRAVK